MSKKIQPMASKILVLPLKTDRAISSGGIEIVDFTLSRGEIIEIGDDVKNIYKKGDIIIFPEASAKNTEQYQGKNMVWLDGRGHPNGDCWGIEYEESTKKNV